MTVPMPDPQTSRGLPLWLAGGFVLGAVLLVGIGALLVNIATRKVEGETTVLQVVAIRDGEVDPAVWGRNYPLEYERFMLTKNDTERTANGGSVKFDKLEAFPAMKVLWAGYPFAEDFTEERGHYYSLIDQKESRRLSLVKQPGACANCHSGDAPNLIRELGWEAFNKGPYSAIADKLHQAITCNDCHDPATMALRITRPALANALEARGVDLAAVPRQEMRTLVCAQCHVEYYFRGENKILTFPWEKGLSIDSINDYYDEYGFRDWTHGTTRAPMLKVQHPEYEMYTSSVHFSSGVACADCHMPYIRQGAVKISDHWVRSPLLRIESACQSCHNIDEEALVERVTTIQARTARQLRQAETAIVAAVRAIRTAMDAGATDEDLAEARDYQRKANLRWDFVSSDNSTGFHSPQEAARVLGDATNFGRLAQLSAERLTMRLTGGAPDDPLEQLDEAAVMPPVD